MEQIRQMIRKQRAWWEERVTQNNDDGDAKVGIGHRYKIRLLISSVLFKDPPFRHDCNFVKRQFEFEELPSLY